MLIRRSKKNKKILFSIITVVFNGEKHIEECIKSVLSQKKKNYEYIVIDGKSTDKTNKIINKYKKKIDVYISEKDKGIYDAFNKGMNYSKGKYICVVNSDDKLTKNALSIIAKYDQKFPKIDFIFGSVRKHWGILHGYRPHKIRYSWGMYSSHSTGFFLSKKAANKVGKYNLKYKCHADYDYFYRMIVKKKLSGVATKKNEITGIFRRGGFSSTIPYKKLFFEEMLIRYDNGQNFLFLLILSLYKILKNWRLFLK
jgi:glycosyltransferase involved in cell wall biosynthesis